MLGLVRETPAIIVYFEVVPQAVEHSFITMDINISCFVYLLCSKSLSCLQIQKKQ
uniref:Uncharacterized protein n=1 Tax=Arundo donax TaxID=35708 RepID=A0A0A9D2C9_ARUDO